MSLHNGMLDRLVFLHRNIYKCNKLQDEVKLFYMYFNLIYVVGTTLLMTPEEMVESRLMTPET